MEHTSRLSRTDGTHGMSADNLNPWSGTAPEEFAALLRRAQVRAGGPSLRTLQRWAEKQQTAGWAASSFPDS